MKTSCFVSFVMCMALGTLGAASAPSDKRLKTVSVPTLLSSQPTANTTDKIEERPLGVLKAPGAVQTRVSVTEASLGTASKVRFTSIKDRQSQTLDARQLAMWGNMSAAFNGDSLQVDLIIAPGDSAITVRVEKLMAFFPQTAPITEEEEECCGGKMVIRSLCGPDNRVASTDNRVGRLNNTGCTGWLVSNGAVLTAGHCGIQTGHILEMNVPASLANGTTVAAAVEDQFPVLAGSVSVWDGDLIAGDDWAVFRIGPNSLGQSAHQRFGFFRMTRETPAVGATLRVTGCGVDTTPVGSSGGENAQTRTLQTSAGPFASESGAEPRISLQYAVDTEGANSGSPVIWEANGFAIGVHTNAGCTGSGGANNGTSFELNAVENAIAAIPGPNCRYLDTIKVPGGAEDGTVFQPHDSLLEAVNVVPAGGRLSIVAGNYSVQPGGITISSPMTLLAPVGTVVLGQ